MQNELAGEVRRGLRLPLVVGLLMWMGAAQGSSPLELKVCVGNPGGVERTVVQQWEEELERILESTGHRLRLAGCDEDGAIQVYFMRWHPKELSALGAARTRQARVLPMVEVYTEPLAALIGTRLPGLLGRAMARVTAHELTHFVRQETEHAEDGAFSGQYTAGLLLAARPAYFGVR